MTNTTVLAGTPTSVRKARVFAAGVLRESGVEASIVELTCLLVSELVTNAVVHARTRVRVTASADAHWVRVEVEDRGPGHPTVRPRSPGIGTGGGLRLVDKLATDWGTTPYPTHKVVWFEIAR